MKRCILGLLFCLALMSLAGCTSSAPSVPINHRWANVDGGQINSLQAGEEFYFNIPADEGMISEGTPVKIKVSGEVQTGSLRFELRNPAGQAVWNSGTIGPGDFSISAGYDLPTGQTGTYQLGLVYSENTSAVYNLSWHAIRLSAGILVPGAGMILVSLAFILYAARQGLLGWRYFGLGALFWVATVMVKFAFAIPFNPLIFRALGVSYDHLFTPGNLVAYLYIGALTGIFEAGLAYFVLRKIRWGKATWKQALVFGIGFGVIEALLLGIVGGISGLTGIMAPDRLPVPTLGSLANNAALVMGLAPIVERLAVIFAHIFACVLIFYAIASNQTRWAWLAILYKTLLDSPAGFANFWGVNTPDKIWTIEAVIAIFGLIGLWGTFWVARRYPQDKP